MPLTAMVTMFPRPLFLRLAAALVLIGGAISAEALTAQMWSMGMIRHPLSRIPPLPERASRGWRWRERPAGRCLPMAGVAGVVGGDSDTIDLVTVSGVRWRARLDKACPPIDPRWGLYLPLAADRLVCANRDEIRSRSGESCRITGFLRLETRR